MKPTRRRLGRTPHQSPSNRSSIIQLATFINATELRLRRNVWQRNKAQAWLGLTSFPVHSSAKRVLVFPRRFRHRRARAGLAAPAFNRSKQRARSKNRIRCSWTLFPLFAPVQAPSLTPPTRPSLFEFVSIGVHSWLNSGFRAEVKSSWRRSADAPLHPKHSLPPLRFCVLAAWR
jgi:hypothetical protein